jgi:ADP-heptose:LPS heptosyltransferase
MISGLINIVKYIVYSIIDLLVQSSNQIIPKSLLIIRLDAIGDYVLFRNFIKILKFSKKYEEHTITLLGNNIWKSLSEELDKEYIDCFIWLDKNKFNRNIIYRYKKLKKITSIGYSEVVSSSFSREFDFGDSIVKSIYAKKKIASTGNLSNMKTWQKKISDKYYTRLIPAKNEIMFEFYRNKEFFENLLEEQLYVRKPSITLIRKNLNFGLPPKYAILFIGASVRSKKWSIQKFAKVAKHITINYGLEIVLLGGTTDRKDSIKFSKYFTKNFINLVGKTSLIDLLYIIYNGKLMISNETLAPHLAVSLERNDIFVISNGNHLGRFTPYPKEICQNYYAIYNQKIEKNFAYYKKYCNNHRHKKMLDINEISVNKVIKRIDSFYKIYVE